MLTPFKYESGKDAFLSPFKAGLDRCAMLNTNQQNNCEKIQDGFQKKEKNYQYFPLINRNDIHKIVLQTQSTEEGGKCTMAKNSTANAKEALNRFKMEAANEVGVNLKQGYNGDLTSKQAGSVGGQMVNNICPVRTMKFIRNYRWVDGHQKEFTYQFRLTV